MTFKQVMDRDVDETFLNIAEFADLHNIDGNNVPALIDDIENIEREKRMKSNMDGIHAPAGVALRQSICVPQRPPGTEAGDQAGWQDVHRGRCHR